MITGRGGCGGSGGAAAEDVEGEVDAMQQQPEVRERMVARHEQRTDVAHEAAAIIPAATVRLVRSSMRMKAPVVRLRP